MPAALVLSAWGASCGSAGDSGGGASTGSTTGGGGSAPSGNIVAIDGGRYHTCFSTKSGAVY